MKLREKARAYIAETGVEAIIQSAESKGFRQLVSTSTSTVEATVSPTLNGMLSTTTPGSTPASVVNPPSIEITLSNLFDRDIPAQNQVYYSQQAERGQLLHLGNKFGIE